MVRAGNMPLDRAHAHARWAGRYEAQGETQRAAAHFGRAVHYAQVAHAFGAPKRARKADLGNIVVGLWEHEAAAWYTLHDLLYSETRKSSRIQRARCSGRPRQARRATWAPPTV